VRQRLIELGWPRDRLTALGTGTPRFPSADATPEERAANRSVSFRVVRDTTGS
jgi:outer membrane protein OmpA-like peptidoglycan-associated protein